MRLLALGAARFRPCRPGLGVAGVLVPACGASLAGVVLYGGCAVALAGPPAGDGRRLGLASLPGRILPFALTALAATLYARVDLVAAGPVAG